MRDTERGRDTSRGRSRLYAGIPMWDSIPGPRIESHIGLLARSLLLPLPVSLPFSVSFMNK